MRRKERVKGFRDQTSHSRMCRIERQHRRPGRGKWAKKQINRRIRHRPIPDDELD